MGMTQQIWIMQEKKVRERKVQIEELALNRGDPSKQQGGYSLSLEPFSFILGHCLINLPCLHYVQLTVPWIPKINIMGVSSGA